MKHLFIFNPGAGNGKISPEQVKEQLQNSGLDFEIYITKGPRDATEYVARRAASGEAIRFYACGGDGTIKETAEGVIGCGNAELSVVPIGSGNDFVKCFGGAENFRDLPALCAAPAMPIDVITVGREHAINACNCGFDAVAADHMIKVKRKKWIGGKNAYTTGLIYAIFHAMKNRGTVWADGEKIMEGAFLMCTISNGKYIGGKFQCAPLADTGDGWLEVCCFRPVSLWKLIRVIGMYERGEHIGNPAFANIMVYRRAKRVEIESQQELTVALDGEIRHMKTLVAEVRPHALSFAAPL